ncbi:MAG: hypothetical protein M3Y28_09950 [Armatimonadota bacterium]|nr:hypothetical protein [Armatimonadota bacterium]
MAFLQPRRGFPPAKPGNRPALQCRVRLVHHACLSLCLFFITSLTHAAQPPVRKAYAKNGALYVVGANGKAKQLSGFSRVKEAALSPDRAHIAFIKGTMAKPISTGSGDAPADQVWLAEADGRLPTLLVTSKDAPDVKNILGGLTAPCFAPNGQTVYFLSQAYAVSDAIHAVDVATKAVRFVCAGNTVEVVTKGNFRGDLIVQQHRYHAGEGGAYDDYWLINPRGKDIKRIGSEAQLRQFKADL